MCVHVCVCTWVLDSIGIVCKEFYFLHFSFDIKIFGAVVVRNVSDPVSKVFLRIMYSSLKFQNNVLLGIKTVILTHKKGSSVMFLDAGVRKPGTNWLEQQGDLLS